MEMTEFHTRLKVVLTKLVNEPRKPAGTVGPVSLLRLVASSSQKPDMEAAVYSSQFDKSETAIAYYTVCSTFVLILENVSVLHKSPYKAKFNGVPKLHESQFQRVVTLL